MFDIDRALQRGLGLHQAGRLSEAEGLYRQILAIDPNNADGLHLLGVLAHETGHDEAAVDLIAKAITRNSRVADFHCNIGNALQGLGRLTEAKAHYRRAIRLNPNHAESHNNFGNALRGQGKLEEALREFRRALGVRPGYAEAHYNLGNTLLDQGRGDEAIHHYQEAIALQPGFAKAHYNLAAVLGAQGKLAEAAACYRQAAAFEPGWAEAHRNSPPCCVNSAGPAKQKRAFARPMRPIPKLSMVCRTGRKSSIRSAARMKRCECASISVSSHRSRQSIGSA